MRLQIDRKNTADMGAMKEIQTFASDESGVGVIELVLILVVKYTPYYGVGIRCIE